MLCFGMFLYLVLKAVAYILLRGYFLFLFAPKLQPNIAVSFPSYAVQFAVISLIQYWFFMDGLNWPWHRRFVLTALS